MQLADTTIWSACPQKDLNKRTKPATEWGWHYDAVVFYAIGEEQCGPPRITRPDFLSAWAKSVVQANGRFIAARVLTRLRFIRKEASITPAVEERWNNVLLPFIRSSEATLKEAIEAAEAASKTEV